MAWLDLTGTRVGRLTLLNYTHIVTSSGRKRSAWRCRCDCGNEIVAMTDNLRKPKHTTSCGCFSKENSGASQRTHGASRSRAYRVYRAMLDRCRNETDYHYRWYGARGITVCDRWLFGVNGKSGFECWRDDMGPKPTPAHTLDRSDNDGNYEPGNCRWATRSEQGFNRRASRLTPRPPQTHCWQGHPLTPDNVYVLGSGSRACKTCARQRRSNTVRKQRAA